MWWCSNVLRQMKQEQQEAVGGGCYPAGFLTQTNTRQQPSDVTWKWLEFKIHLLTEKYSYAQLKTTTTIWTYYIYIHFYYYFKIESSKVDTNYFSVSRMGGHTPANHPGNQDTARPDRACKQMKRSGNRYSSVVVGC